MAALRSVYDSETQSLREAMRRLLVVERRCVRSTDRMWQNNFMSDSEVRRKVLTGS